MMRLKNYLEGLKVERTGRIYSIASSEFLATFPDGTTNTFWSPPWHEWEAKSEERRAYLQALKHWNEKQVQTA